RTLVGFRRGRRRGANAGNEVLAGSDGELVEDVAEVGLDGLNADVQLGGGLLVGAAGADQTGHRLFGRGQDGEGWRSLRSGGRRPWREPRCDSPAAGGGGL